MMEKVRRVLSMTQTQLSEIMPEMGHPIWLHLFLLSLALSLGGVDVQEKKAEANIFAPVSVEEFLAEIPTLKLEVVNAEGNLPSGVQIIGLVKSARVSIEQ